MRVPSIVINKSIEIYERLEQKNLMKKAVKNSYLSAVFFMAANSLGFLLSPSDISNKTGCELNQMYKYYKKMMEALQDIQIEKSAEKHVKFICQKLELGDYMMNMSLRMCEKMKG